MHSWELAAAQAITRELLVTARGVSLLAAVAATWLAYAISRRMGASWQRALVGAIASLAAPWTVFTAWAAGVPEMPCVAWTLAAVWFFTPEGESSNVATVRAIAAGACLSIACGHRYEAWFASVGMLAAFAARGPSRAGLRRTAGAALTASLFPIAWLAINLARSGDAFDFVHRVVRYRTAVEPQHDAVRSLARVWWDVTLGSGIAIVAGLASAKALGRRAAVPIAGAAAVVVGVAFIEARGGGATHHAGRTLLVAVWLLVPLVPFVTRSAYGWTALVAAIFVQHAIGWRALPRDIAPATVEAGRALRQPQHGCYAIETGQLDFLWVEVASGRPEDAHPDRVFGTAAPTSERWLEIARACPLAVAHTEPARDSLITAGWWTMQSAGGWTVLRAPLAMN